MENAHGVPIRPENAEQETWEHYQRYHCWCKGQGWKPSTYESFAEFWASR